MRKASIRRKTKETDIELALNIDGSGRSRITSDIGFLSHMLETLAKHGLFDMNCRIKGDIHVDQHHTIEDVGIVLGEAFREALGDKRGLRRSGFSVFPMDEALVMTAIDISGRPYLRFEAELKSKKVGDFHTDTLEDFFQGFVSSLGATLHITVYCGRSDHHKIEAMFKSFARSLRIACETEKRLRGGVPSTKGAI